MSTKLSKTFDRLRGEHRKAVMPFITAGYPNYSRFLLAVDAICESGADILEIGFPHSDPLADGPVIQHSSHEAILNGFTVDGGFDAIKKMAGRHALPIIVMCYSNLILRAGPERFVGMCRNAGVSGLIVPDMIIEESADLRSICTRHDVAFINLVTPTTPTRRARAISQSGSGFLYLVSVAGTTGVRRRFNDSVARIAKSLKKANSLPVCIGFGISTAEMAAKAAQHCDGVIIGSKILQLIDSSNGNDNFPALRQFLNDVRTRLGGRP